MSSSHDQLASEVQQGCAPNEVIEAAAAQKATLATAESLTAGLLSSHLADVPGASAVLRGGMVTYCNEVKQDLLGVSAELLAEVGAVDAEVAVAMSLGAAQRCRADIGVATTGVAGPDAHQGMPVGTVFLAVCWKQEVLPYPLPGLLTAQQALPAGWNAGALKISCPGTRSAVREASARAGMALLAALLRAQAQTDTRG